jgi:hypothetical protein
MIVDWRSERGLVGPPLFQGFARVEALVTERERVCVCVAGLNEWYLDAMYLS